MDSDSLEVHDHPAKIEYKRLSQCLKITKKTRFIQSVKIGKIEKYSLKRHLVNFVRMFNKYFQMRQFWEYCKHCEGFEQLFRKNTFGKLRNDLPNEARNANCPPSHFFKQMIFLGRKYVCLLKRENLMHQFVQFFMYFRTCYSPPLSVT